MPIVANQIVNTIETRLASIDGTFIDDLPITVVRPTARGVSPAHGQIAIGYGPNIRNPAFDVPGNPFREGRTQTVELKVYVRDEMADSQITEQALEVYGEIVGAIKTGSDWYSIGDVAIDADIGDMEPIEPSGGLGGFRIVLDVHYRTPEATVEVAG